MALNIQPEFEVEYITGDFTRMITVIEETNLTRIINGVEKIFTTRKLKPVEEKFTEGVMVYYPQGHSLFVAADDEAQLVNLGVMQDPRLVDLESGQPVPDGYNLSPKDIVKRKENNRPRARVGGLKEALE